MSKKSTYKTVAEALTFNKLKDVDVSLGHLDKRRLTVDEIKQVIKESFGKAKDAAEVKAKELENGWGDADIENELKWVDALKLKEFFDAQAVSEEKECGHEEGEDCEHDEKSDEE